MSTSSPVSSVQCDREKAPDGWYCTRESGHEGPCAAVQINVFNHCGHGVSYKNKCRQCELISAEQTAKNFGRMVDEARQLLADAAPGELEKAYGR